MKLYFFIILSISIISISCKCNCDGVSPEISPTNQKMIIFKNDTIIDFIRNGMDTIKVNVSMSPIDYSNHSKSPCVNPFDLFSKKCDCPSDYTLTSGYDQWNNSDSISFSLSIMTDITSSFVSYNFNKRIFYVFDSTNISKMVNNKLLTGINIKTFPGSWDPLSQIYYSDSLGLVSIIYKNGTRINLK